MRCAVVQNLTNVVVNLIIADPTDQPPEDCYLVGVPDGVFVDIGWLYDPSTGEFSPPQSGA